MLEKTEVGNKLVGIYRGIVLKHLPHGYCKIMIPGVYPLSLSSYPDELPSAEQATSLFAGANNGNGVFSYPNIGATVWCLFANGDQNLPVYFASALGGEYAFGQHYNVFQTPNETSSARHLISSGKSHVEIYENGTISSIVRDPQFQPVSVDFISSQVSGLQDPQTEQSAIISTFVPWTTNSQQVMAQYGEISCSTEVLSNDHVSTSYIQRSHAKEAVQTLHAKNFTENTSLSSFSIAKQHQAKSLLQILNDNDATSCTVEHDASQDFASYSQHVDNGAAETFSKIDIESGRLDASYLAEVVKPEVSSQMSLDTTGNAHIHTIDPQTTCFIDMKTAGTIVINVEGKKKSVVTMTSNGIMTIETTDAVNVKTTTTDINSLGGVTIEGNTTITGTLKVTGQIDGGADIIAAKDCKASNCTLNTHTHPYVAPMHPGGLANTSVGI